tara:strand:- start:1412 stop:1606 length:195 start_codon:yes stop_codon:yes gene_type:complete
MEQAEPKKRVRINVSTSVRGVRTADATVEYYDRPDTEATRQLVLAEVTGLMEMLDRHYPPQEVS